MVKNMPANALGMGLISDPGRPTCHRATKPGVPQLLSLCSRAQEPQLLKPTYSRACSQQQDKATEMRSLCTATGE